MPLKNVKKKEGKPMKTNKLPNWTFRCSIFILSFLMIAMAIGLCIRMNQKHSSTLREIHLDFVKLMEFSILEYEDCAAQHEKDNPHKTFYIRYFWVPCVLKMIDHVKYNLIASNPISVGAWLSEIAENPWDSECSEDLPNDLKGNGFLLLISTLCWGSDNGSIGIPEDFKIEIDGFPAFHTELSLAKRLNLQTKQFPESLNCYWNLVDLTPRVWLQFNDKPIPESIREAVDEGRFGFVKLPPDFPKSLRELSVREAKVRVRSPNEDTTLSIQFDVYPLNPTEEREQ